MDKIELIGIARHRISIDGSGVTSLVCTKRCPLSCEYCVNKEQMLDEAHIMNLDEESLYNKLKIDNLYFQATHGGVTFGGGEPLIYADFICDFSKKYKGSWKIGLETSLNVPQNQLEKVIPYIDEYIIDIKDMNPEIYLRYTGMKNELVIQNLRLLIDRLGAKNLYVRVPLIPEYNTELDRNYSEEILKEMGIKHIEKFFYSIPQREIQLIKNNPYTYKVTEAQTCYTKAFKKEFSQRYQAGESSRAIVEVLGGNRTKNTKEAKQKYAKHQAEKYSLNPENQKKYGTKELRHIRGKEPGKFASLFKEELGKVLKNECIAKSNSFGLIKANIVVSGYDGTSKSEKPGTVIDHLGLDEKTEMRTIYGDKTLKKNDITSYDHNYSQKHPFGNHRERRYFMMKMNIFMDILDDCCNDVTFTFSEKPCGIIPEVNNYKKTYYLYYGDDTQEFDSAEAVVNARFFDGKTIKDIFDKIEISC